MKFASTMPSFDLQILIDAKKGWVTVEKWSCPGRVPWAIFREGSQITLYRDSLTKMDFDYSREVHEELRVKKETSEEVG